MDKLGVFFVSVSERTGKVTTGKCVFSIYCVVDVNVFLYEVKPTPKVRFIGCAADLLNKPFKKNGVWYAFGKTSLDAKRQISEELCWICETKKAEYENAVRLYNSVACSG